MPQNTIRLHDLSARDVVARAESTKVGTTSDLLFSPRDGRIGAIMIETASGFGGLMRQQNAVLGDALLAIGHDAIIVTGKDAVVEDGNRINRSGLVSAADVRGRTVMTDDGRKIGVVAEFELDVDDGRILNYLIDTREGDRGIFDLRGGREEPRRELVIPVREDVTVGPDLITVPQTLLTRGGYEAEEPVVRETRGETRTGDRFGREDETAFGDEELEGRRRFGAGDDRFTGRREEP